VELCKRDKLEILQELSQKLRWSKILLHFFVRFFASLFFGSNQYIYSKLFNFMKADDYGYFMGVNGGSSPMIERTCRLMRTRQPETEASM